jgi:hypothetical protein
MTSTKNLPCIIRFDIIPAVVSETAPLLLYETSMKAEIMKTKIKSIIHSACHSFRGAVCVVAVLLISSSVQAQNLFVSDYLDNNIYEFTPGGVQSTFASGLDRPWGLAFNSAGNLFEADTASGNVYEFTPGGARSTFASGLASPSGVAFDGAGNLFVANYGNGTVTKITPGGTQSTFASGFGLATGLAFDNAGNLFVVSTGVGGIYKITLGGPVSTFAAGFYGAGLAFNSAGNLFAGFDQSPNGYIAEFTPGGVESTFATGLNYPVALAFNSAGNLFVGNQTSGIITKITPGGVESNFATVGEVQGLAFQPVPEPSTLGLLAIGATALVVRRRC